MTAPLETETHVQREPARRRLPSWLLGSGVIAVAMGVMNVATYGFTILAARLLGPSEYGALAAVMGLLMVVSVLSLGRQATGARRVAASPGGRAAVARDDRVDQARLAEPLRALDAHVLGDALELWDELSLEGAAVESGVHEAMPLPSGRSGA